MTVLMKCEFFKERLVNCSKCIKMKMIQNVLAL